MNDRGEAEVDGVEEEEGEDDDENGGVGGAECGEDSPAVSDE